MNKAQKRTPTKSVKGVSPKAKVQKKRVAKKAMVKQQRRKMTIFAGAQSTESEQVFATGTVKRTAGGKTSTFPMALEFTATPQLKTLAATQHRFIPGSGLVDVYTEALLVDAKGESGKVKPMTVEPILKDGNVKFTGPNFAWTKAAISAVNLDGSKIDTSFDFGKDKVSFKLAVKGGKDDLEESGDFAVVEKAGFYDFIRASKTSHERMQVEKAAV